MQEPPAAIPEIEVPAPPEPAAAEPAIDIPVSPEPAAAEPVIDIPAPAPEPTPPAAEIDIPLPTAAETAPAPAPPAEEKKPLNPFLARDPRQKARRLARALVSDMIVYQPDKRQRALADGTIKEAFAEEIKKSWEEFVDQVGKEMAESTTFFTDALNDILADGQQLF